MKQSHNFAAQWHALTAQDDNHRGARSADLAFWQQHAAGYDKSALAEGSYEQTLAAIQAYTRPTDTLLDVGAGTGRFAIPLAQQVRRVTALDHAAPMLKILRAKANALGLKNVDLLVNEWECIDPPQHDIVLAAWSLYRLPDIVAGMQKLVAATKRTLLIVTSPGNIHGDTPMHVYFYGALWQTGVYPELHIIWEKSDPVALIVWHRR